MFQFITLHLFPLTKPGTQLADTKPQGSSCSPRYSVTFLISILCLGLITSNIIQLFLHQHRSKGEGKDDRLSVLPLLPTLCVCMHARACCIIQLLPDPDSACVLCMVIYFLVSQENTLVQVMCKWSMLVHGSKLQLLSVRNKNGHGKAVHSEWYLRDTRRGEKC